MAQKRKKKLRETTGRSSQPPSFPGTSGLPSHVFREPEALAFDPTQLRGMTSVQLRNQLRPLIDLRNRIRRRFPSLADLWTQSIKPTERRLADRLEQAEELIRHIEKEMATRKRVNDDRPKSKIDAVHKAKTVDEPGTSSPMKSSGYREDLIFTASVDYRSVRYKGNTFTLTRNQSTIVRLLHSAHTGGHPDVDKDRLLSVVERETSQVRNLFRNSPLWKTLVVSKRRGTYRLSLPDEESSKTRS